MLKFKDKKYVLIFVLSIFISVATLLGGSYALIQRVITGNNTYSMRTGNFLVEFKDNNTISLSNQTPTYDNVGIKSSEKFVFSVTNTGNYISNYAVKIVETSSDTLGEVIRYAVDYGDGFSYENVHSLQNNQYIIQNKSLAVGATDTYKVVFWLDIDASEIYIEKDFSAKVVIESTQDEYKYGNITKNTNLGIFGIYNHDYPVSEKLKVSEDIKIGNAYFQTVLSGEKIEKYDIEITSINKDSKIKNITFKITDEKLIDKTGGIVQGMSGSPIIQDGKLLGAVTHVLVNNPAMGYGIFIENMLDAAA